MDGFIFGWLMGSFLIGVVKSIRRYWYLWLAAFAAFLIYQHLAGANRVQ